MRKNPEPVIKIFYTEDGRDVYAIYGGHKIDLSHRKFDNFQPSERFAAFEEAAKETSITALGGFGHIITDTRGLNDVFGTAIMDTRILTCAIRSELINKAAKHIRPTALESLFHHRLKV